MNSARWNAYLAIEYKAESGGKGDDHTSLEQVQPKVDFFKQWAPPADYEFVFNPGCGTGESVKLLTEAGYKPIGYTLGKDNVTYAKEHYNVDLLEQDMHMPGFNDQSFDAIYTDNVCEHTISLHILLLEFYRILRTGGRFYIDVPDPENPGIWKLQWHHTLMPAVYWKRYVEGYGFKLIHSENNGYTMIFEKLPPEKHPNWNYFQHIYRRMQEATNGD